MTQILLFKLPIINDVTCVRNYSTDVRECFKLCRLLKAPQLLLGKHNAQLWVYKLMMELAAIGYPCSY